MIISHNTALEWFRSHPESAWESLRTNEAIAIPKNSVGVRGLQDLRKNFGLFAQSEQPTHILTHKPARISRSKHVVIHKKSEALITKGLALDLGNNRYVCGPELCFLQMASTLPFLSLVVLGYELCGTYSHFAPLISGFYKRPALSSSSKMQRFLQSSLAVTGKEKARQALRYILDNSASPMETVIACALTLPKEYGGQGFIQPKLNYAVAFDKVSNELTGTAYARIDIAWPKLLFGIEYDSDMAHINPAKDRRRREALAHHGWTICTIDTTQIKNYGELARSIRLIEAAIPRVRGKQGPTEGESKKLFSVLMRLTRAQLGLEKLLFPTELKGEPVEYVIK